MSRTTSSSRCSAFTRRKSKIGRGRADKSGPDVEATLNINDVNIVTFWSMSDPCRNLEEGECARNPLCEFQSECRKKLTKEAIDVYVIAQIRAQTGYLNALANCIKRDKWK